MVVLVKQLKWRSNTLLLKDITESCHVQCIWWHNLFMCGYQSVYTPPHYQGCSSSKEEDTLMINIEVYTKVNTFKYQKTKYFVLSKYNFFLVFRSHFPKLHIYLFYLFFRHKKKLRGLSEYRYIHVSHILNNTDICMCLRYLPNIDIYTSHWGKSFPFCLPESCHLHHGL